MAYQPEIEKLEQRYESDPGRNFAQLAEAYRRGGRYDDALNLLRPHLEERPNYVSGLIVLGRVLLDMQEDDEARDTFERVLAVDAEHIIALKALADIAERGGDVAGARNWLERLLEVDPMNGEAAEALERLPAAAEAEVETPASAPADHVRAAEPGAVAGFEPTVAEPAEESTEPAPIVDLEPSGAGDSPAGPVPTVLEMPAVDAAAVAGAGEGDELVIERTSDEYSAVQPDIGPVEVEQASEALPPTVEVPAVSLEDGTDEAADADVAAPAPADADETSPMEAVPEPGELGIEAFDSTLGWGTGERTSRQISAADLRAAEQVHQEGLETAAEEIPGLKGAETPDAGAAETQPLESVEPMVFEGADKPVEPLAGLSPTEVAPADDSVVAGDETLELTDASGEPVDDLMPSVGEAAAGGDLDLVVEKDTDIELVAGQPEDEPSYLPEAADATSVESPLDATVVEEAITVPPAETVIEEAIVVDAGEAEPIADEAPPAEPAEEGEPATVEIEAVSGVDVVPEAAEEDEAPADLEEEADDSLSGLPVFLPESGQEAAGTDEPEPVLTETMAEVYARQGLVAEARDVYRRLLESRPDDERLAARLAELEREPSDAPAGGRRDRYAASATGGESARSFLVEILAAKVQPTQPEPSAEGSASPAAAVPEPEDATPLDDAFAADAVDPSGAPTVPATDEVSLATVFGESPAPAPPPAAPPSDAPASSDAGAGSDEPTGGFSFDEFFGGKKPPPTSADEPKPARDTLGDDEGDEAFRNWLKGLKS